MKTTNIIATLRNAATPAARLAAWQNKHISNRRRSMADYYDETSTLAERRRALIASTGPELSSPDAENPLLWADENSPEILDSYAGRDCGLDHRGWYTDDFQDETLETYAVRLTRFPHLLFYAVLDSCDEGLRVHLDEWEEIDFSECGSDYGMSEAIKDSARQVVRSNDSTTEREAEESREYYRKDQVERDIAENKETLASLRHEIRALAHELKTLCPSSLAIDYPAAANALRDSLKSLLKDRRELTATNANLAASL